MVLVLFVANIAGYVKIQVNVIIVRKGIEPLILVEFNANNVRICCALNAQQQLVFVVDV